MFLEMYVFFFCCFFLPPQIGTKSIAHYTPQNMLGYGSLLCWASNIIGKAKEPCVSKVIPVGKCCFTSLLTPYILNYEIMII